ncbi:MAG: hypothetical protein AAF213_12475 [Pseudomonadota bacterium]
MNNILRAFKAMAGSAAVLAIAMGVVMASKPVATAQLAAPELGSLHIARLVDLIGLIADERETYAPLNTELLTRWDAVPKDLVADGKLVSAWGGEVRAAPFNTENTLARLHLSAVPRTICVELSFLLLDQSRVAGLYINSDQIDIEPENFGAMMLELGRLCPDDPSEIDVIIR